MGTSQLGYILRCICLDSKCCSLYLVVNLWHKERQHSEPRYSRMLWRLIVITHLWWRITGLMLKTVREWEQNYPHALYAVFQCRGLDSQLHPCLNETIWHFFLSSFLRWFPSNQQHLLKGTDNWCKLCKAKEALHTKPLGTNFSILSVSFSVVSSVNC